MYVMVVSQPRPSSVLRVVGSARALVLARYLQPPAQLRSMVAKPGVPASPHAHPARALGGCGEANEHTTRDHIRPTCTVLLGLHARVQDRGGRVLGNRAVEERARTAFAVMLGLHLCMAG